MRLRLCTFNIENLFTRFEFSAFTDRRSQSYLPPIVRFLGDFEGGDFTKFADFKRLVEAATVSQDDDKRQHTALAFAEADADVYCLQEVDNLDALTRFMDFYVGKIGVKPYPNLILQEGNDPRGIVVAAITRDIRPAYARSHATLTPAWIDNTPTEEALFAAFPKAKKKSDDLRGRIFCRDCLELEVIAGDTRNSLFN